MESAASDRWKLLAWRIAVFTVLVVGAWTMRDFRWGVVWRSAPFLLKSLGVSWMLAISALTIGLIAAILLAAARLYGVWGVRHLAVAYIEVIRAVPQIMVIFWVYFSLPKLTGATLDPWPAGVLALSMIASAYLAEVIRAGLMSVPRIQTESAYATGLGSIDSFSRILLPQALRNMLPALIAHFIMIFKLTAVVYIIGLIDFFRAIILVNNRDYAPFALYITAGLVYYICNFGLSWIIRRLDPVYTLTS